MLLPLFWYAQVGVNTTTPQKTLHVNGSLQITNELNVGGNGTTAGDAGTVGQVLISGGPGIAPSWQTRKLLPGSIYSTNYLQGTISLNIPQGTTSDVLGITITLTVPTGITQTFLFTILGYATSSPTTDTAAQGVFTLLQNNVKISSAYASKVGDAKGLSDLPIPVTFLKAVSLPAGTYTFKVQYNSWSGNQTVNYNPSNYSGYNGDTEAMLTKMQIFVYNN